MKLFSLFKSAKRAENRRNRLAVRAKRPNILEQSDFFEGLEKRQLLTATYRVSGTELIIDLSSTGNLNISSTGSSYLFSLEAGATNTWSGSGTVSVVGSNLTANSSSFDKFTVTRSAAGPLVNFKDSGANSYNDNFNLSLSNASIGAAGFVTFYGNTTFANSSSLSIVTDYAAKMNATSTLTMTNGNLSMSINTQATPTVTAVSGLFVDSNATIQTNGTGQTTIEARGGNGPCTTFQNKGVAVVRGGKIIGGTTGNLSITGYGYNNLSIASGNNWQGQGVLVYSNVPSEGLSTITSRGANVFVTGYGANDTTANLAALSACAITNAGVVVGLPAALYSTPSLRDSGGLITSGGNGTVRITGYGGSLANQPVYTTGVEQRYYSQSMGVFISGANASISSGGAGNVSVTGTGGGAYANTPYGIGVHLYQGKIQSGANASVFVNGTGFLNSNTQLQFGVHLYGDSCITTGPGSGSTTVIGQGGGLGTNSYTNYGVYLWKGGNSTITAGGSGNVTVTGTGGFSEFRNNIGVYLNGDSNSNPTITSNGGAVQVTGYGGNGNTSSITAASSAQGVTLELNARITAGGLGDVTVTGYGGNNNGSNGTLNHGVFLTPGNLNQPASWITSSGGNVTVLGVGGGGNANSTPGRGMACNTGVCVACGSYITAGGSGNVTVTGQGGGRSPGATGGNNHGVYVGDGNRTAYSAGNMAYSCISSSGGTVTVTGFGGGGSGNTVNSTSAINHGVNVAGGGTITSGGNADVNINGTGGSFGNSTSTGSDSEGVYVTGTQLPGGAPPSTAAYRSTLSTGGSGNLTVNGTGGGSGTGGSNVGIFVQSGALVTAGGTTSSVTLVGQGGNTTGQQNYGVQISGTMNSFPSTVTSNGGNVSVTGCAPLSSNGGNQHGVILYSNGIVTSGGNGSVTITGRAGTGDNTISGVGHVGVQIASNASISSGGSGPVNITGYGGGSGIRNFNIGVYLVSGGVITGGANAPVTVNGYGGNANGTGSDNYGVNLTGVGTKITSSNGTVQVTGFGGQTNATVSGSGGNTGVYVESGAEVSSTGTAPITVNGTGGGLGTQSGGNNHGVMIYTLGTGNSTPKITSSGGLVTVTGIAGGTNSGSSNSHGVIIGSGGLVSTSGNGTDIIINGTGGGGTHPSYTNHGIYMAGTANASNYTITANGGDIFLNGTAGPSLGSVGVYACTTTASVIGNATTPGTVTIVTNSVSLATTAGSAINASTNITLQPRTAGLAVTLGCTTDTRNGPLTLSAAELATLSASNIQIGNATTGNYTIAGPVTIPAASNLTLLSNTTGTGIQSTATSGTGITMGAGKALNVASLAGLNTVINGTIAQTYYNQLNVVGDLSLSGKSLNLSGIYTPTGGDVFTIANATSLTGTFTGLADGSTTTFNGRTLFVNYTPTTATLTDPAPKLTSSPAEVTVIAGNSTSFSASATGTPAPTVQWQVLVPGGSWSNIANATSPTYNLTTASGDNGNRYRAVFTNTYGNATTNPVTLTVQFAPSISTQPTNQSANDGQTATFTAAATGNPAPTVQWQVNTGSGWANVTDGSGDTTDSYTTVATTSGMNGYQYRAIYTNGIGSYATSNAVTLTVNSATSAPSITTQPTNQIATAGNTATFTAAASGSPTPTVQWQVNTGSGWSNVTDGSGGTTDSYTTAATTSGMNGYQYRAVYTNGIGSDATSNAVTLTVNAATSVPVITTQPVNTGVEAGQTATFSAAATGNPTPTVQWQSSPDGSTGWSDIGGATSATLSFTASAGDNGKYYRAVFTNGISPDATTNAAKLLVGIAPVITSINEMTIPVGLTSGMTVIATGSPAPTYSIASGSLPAGVTLDSTTGLFMGTPAPGTAGNWPLTIKADNGIGNGATQAFTLKVTSTITSFTVSKGISQRSYVRYLDLGMDSNASALALLNNPSRVQLTKADLNGVGSTPVSLTGFLSVPTGQSTLAIDFGTIGLGNSRNTTAADGYYTLGVDLDGNGSYETNLFFFRLFGDTNSDREVTAADQSAVLAGCTQPYNANLDTNGDGVVNTSDYQYVKKSVGRKLKSTLIVTA